MFSILDSWHALGVSILSPESSSIGSRRGQDYTVRHRQPVLDAESSGCKRERRVKIDYRALLHDSYCLQCRTLVTLL